jgi:hypothetical protein
MERILPGSKVLARSAFGELLPRRAVTGVIMGRDFQVVLVCSEGEWEAAHSQGRDPEGIPWPAEDVKLVEHVHA